MRNIKNNALTLRKSLLALAIGAVAHSAQAAAADTSNTHQEDTLVVQATPASDFTPGGDVPVPAYLDGQVAHGGRLGMLGEQKAMDVPFNVIGYTAKAVEDLQAKNIADGGRKDAGVQPGQGFGNTAATATLPKPIAFVALSSTATT